MKNINLSRSLLPASLKTIQMVGGKSRLFMFCFAVSSFLIQGLAAQCTVAFSSCPPDQTIVDCDNSGSEKLVWPLILAYNAGFCNNWSVTQTGGPAFNSIRPTGIYPITYTATAINATNGSTITKTCQFNVNVVKDVQPPTFTSCPPNITVYGTDNGSGSCSTQAFWPTPTSSDNCDSITITATGGLSCGSIFSNGAVTTVSYSATDASGNSATCSFTVTVICVVGTSSLEKTSFQVRITPNPNPGTFTVELPEPAKPGMSFQITDLTGRLIQQQKTEPGSTQQTVRAGELPNGLYFLQVVSEGKILAVEKFVKQ